MGMIDLVLDAYAFFLLLEQLVLQYAGYTNCTKQSAVQELSTEAIISQHKNNFINRNLKTKIT